MGWAGTIMERPSFDAIKDEPTHIPVQPVADVRIQLLGRFRIDAGPGSVDETGWRLRKARSLIKLLALAPNRQLYREQIFDLLWPDLDRDAASNNLRSTLHVARRMIEGDPPTPAPALDARGDLPCVSP